MTHEEIVAALRTITQSLAVLDSDLSTFAVSLKAEDLTDDSVARALSEAQGALSKTTGKASDVIDALFALKRAAAGNS